MARVEIILRNHGAVEVDAHSSQVSGDFVNFFDEAEREVSKPTSWLDRLLGGPQETTVTEKYSVLIASVAKGDVVFSRTVAASVDTLPKGQDAKQGLAGTEGSAVGEAETPNLNPATQPTGEGSR